MKRFPRIVQKLYKFITAHQKILFPKHFPILRANRIMQRMFLVKLEQKGTQKLKYITLINELQKDYKKNAKRF